MAPLGLCKLLSPLVSKIPSVLLSLRSSVLAFPLLTLEMFMNPIPLMYFSHWKHSFFKLEDRGWIFWGCSTSRPLLEFLMFLSYSNTSKLNLDIYLQTHPLLGFSSATSSRNWGHSPSLYPPSSVPSASTSVQTLRTPVLTDALAILPVVLPSSDAPVPLWQIHFLIMCSLSCFPASMALLEPIVPDHVKVELQDFSCWSSKFFRLHELPMSCLIDVRTVCDASSNLISNLLSNYHGTDMLVCFTSSRCFSCLWCLFLPHPRLPHPFVQPPKPPKTYPKLQVSNHPSSH